MRLIRPFNSSVVCEYQTDSGSVMDYLEVLEYVINMRLERRVLWDDINPMKKLNDVHCFQSFRFSKGSALK